MNSRYIMENPLEAQRLSQKVDPATWLDTYIAPYVSSQSQILDVGCGPGVLTAEVARRYSNAEIIGLDISPQRLEYATQQTSLENLHFQCANSTHLPFPDNSFDLVYSRFMLEYLSDPLSAVSEMVRVCKPGGRVILQDIDGQLVSNYPVPDFEADLQAVLDELSKTGHDVFVGRKLFYFALKAGLDDISVKMEPYHLFPGRISDKEYKEWELKFDIALPMAVKIHGEKKAKELKQAFLNYLLREDTLTFSILFTIVGETPVHEP